MMHVPHLRVVVAACAVAIAGYTGFSIWAIGYSNDAAMKGDVIGTWKSFATAAFFFWIGSSSGGKGRDGQTQGGPEFPPTRPPVDIPEG
jgi:hypothetical protein